MRLRGVQGSTWARPPASCSFSESSPAPLEREAAGRSGAMGREGGPALGADTFAHPPSFQEDGNSKWHILSLPGSRRANLGWTA